MTSIFLLLFVIIPCYMLLKKVNSKKISKTNIKLEQNIIKRELNISELESVTKESISVVETVEKYNDELVIEELTHKTRLEYWEDDFGENDTNDLCNLRCENSSIEEKSKELKVIDDCRIKKSENKITTEVSRTAFHVNNSLNVLNDETKNVNKISYKNYFNEDEELQWAIKQETLEKIRIKYREVLNNSHGHCNFYYNGNCEKYGMNNIDYLECRINGCSWRERRLQNYKIFYHSENVSDEEIYKDYLEFFERNYYNDDLIKENSQRYI